MSTDNMHVWGDLEVHPGYTIRQELVARGVTQRDLAERMGQPEQVVSDIVNGYKPITESTARGLEEALDIPAAFWINLESVHATTRARLAQRLARES